jgi:microcystin-dependent protein
MPSHNHSLVPVTLTVPVSVEDADQDEAEGKFLANGTFYHNAGGGTYGSGPLALTGQMGLNGGGQSVNNMQPYLAMGWHIALFGTYPSRS